MRTTWELINEVSGKKPSTGLSKVEKKEGSGYNSPTDLMIDWKTYFSDLLNVTNTHLAQTPPIPPAETDLEINVDPITE